MSFPDNIRNYSKLFFTGFLLFLFFSAFFARGQTSTSIYELASILNEFSEAYPQQKAFLHTDKSVYHAGETIWLKAYVVNASTHLPDTLSTNLYVELLDQKGNTAYMLLLRSSNGVAHGEIDIHDSIPGGNYRFRVYTDWMRNFHEDFLYTQDIYIHNPIEENFIRRLNVLRNRRFNRDLAKKREEMQFAFFPEGGKLVAGLKNRVAFKAADALGAGVEAQGVLVDGGGKEIARFSTFFDGMGSFAFTPEQGKTYTAQIRFANGQQKRPRLPKAEAIGCLLSVQKSDDGVHVGVESNFDAVAGTFNDTYYLLIHTRGQALHVEQFKLEDRLYELRIPREDFPGGVSSIMLLDGEAKPLAERMVFINHDDIGQVHLTEKSITNHPDGKKVEVSLELDKQHNGSYSLVVLDTGSRSEKLRNNIAAELLLFSDLASTRNHAAFYLDTDSEKAAEAVDLLMLTHFWRRHDWNSVLAGEHPEIRYGFPRGITIAGQVTPRSSARETGEMNVELVVQQDSIEMFNTTTDKKGNFYFTNLDYDGYFTAMLRAERGTDKRAFYIELGGRKLSDRHFMANLHTRPLETTARSDDWERVPRPETTMASRRSFAASPTSPTMYGDVDQVIYFDDIREQYSRVIDVLETRVRGLVVERGQILLRGPSSIIHNNEPLFLIDDQVVSRGLFLQTNIQEIDRLTVISGPQSAVFGRRGSNGALLLYTVRGDRHIYESFEYLIKGFHTPAESFESRIYINEYDAYDIDRTIFWEPNVEIDENNIISFPVSIDKHVRNTRLIFQGVDETGKVFFSDFFIDIEGSE